MYPSVYKTWHSQERFLGVVFNFPDPANSMTLSTWRNHVILRRGHCLQPRPPKIGPRFCCTGQKNLHQVRYTVIWCGESCYMSFLTHWGRVTHICVDKLTIIGSDNGLSPERRQAIIWTNAGILLIGPLGTNFSEILIEIQTFSLKKIRLKMSSAKFCSFCPCLNVLHWSEWALVHLYRN